MEVPATLETVRRFKFDVAVVGCTASDVDPDADADIHDFDILELSAIQVTLGCARLPVAVADH